MFAPKLKFHMTNNTEMFIFLIEHIRVSFIYRDHYKPCHTHKLSILDNLVAVLYLNYIYYRNILN